MIIVVEGISAAGKTTWCRKVTGVPLLPETFPADRHEQPAFGQRTAEYWARWNAMRWANALSLEHASCTVICDTDPLKCHYAWGLWQLGEAPKSQWQWTLEATRALIADRMLGIADLFLVKPVAPEIALAQMAGDATRVRDRFELHLRLQTPLLAWYQAVEKAFPGRVQWGLPDDFTLPAIEANEARYDLAAFDKIIGFLPTR